MIPRLITPDLLDAAREYPVVTVFGPRQSGKTTLVRAAFPDKPYRSLEEPDVRLVAQQDPRGFLAGFPEGAVLDEVQHVPELLSYIQSLVDQRRTRGQFILTGSHQPAVHQAVSQSLAGRTAVLTLLPFAWDEIRHYQASLDPFELIVQGCYPRLHEDRLQSERFFNSYIQTYVERDVRALINLKDLRRFQQFLVLVAGRVGQLVNYSSLGNDVGVSSTTIKDWIATLTASFLVFELSPYFENVGKRLIKSPKLYFLDTGIAAHLAGIRTAEQCRRDPLRGALYENFVILEILKRRLNRGQRPDIYFYRDSRGNEVDLIIREGARLVPIEIKSAATFSDEFHTGIRRFRETVGRKASGGAVLYGGPDAFQFKDCRVLNPLTHADFDSW